MAIEDIINTVRDEFGLNETVVESSWVDRLAEAAYTPPSGLRITFDYTDLSTGFTKKTTAFNFPDADGTLIQDHGVSEFEYPMRVFFSGAEHDRQAAVFDAALRERGAGTLESPLYGTHTVVPMGKVTRRDDLVTAANQTIFEVSFMETIDLIYPIGTDDPANAVLTAVDLFGESADASFATALSVESVAEQQDVIDTILAGVDKIESTLDSVAAVQQSVASTFQDGVDTVRNTIDVLIGQPLTLAFETRRLAQAPARATASITRRLDAYRNLAADIFGAPDAVSEPGGPGNTGPELESRTGVGNDAQQPNRFHSRDLLASSFLSGSVLSVLYTSGTGGAASGTSEVNVQQSEASTGGPSKFETAGDALSAAADLLSQWTAYVAWRDANYKNIAGGNLTEAEQLAFIAAPSNTDSSDAYARLQTAVSMAAGFLVNLSFSLKRESAVVLDRDRSIIDLAYELYGDISNDTIDFLINSNGLALDTIIEIPRGRRVVYYV